MAAVGRTKKVALLALLIVWHFPHTAAAIDDPIVGTWVGKLTQAGQEPYDMEVTFVSPRGGVTRYPVFPCGGTLVGGPKGNAYEYEETVNWGGLDENPRGCIGGHVQISIEGDKMTFAWSSVHEGQAYEAAGELQRQNR